MFANLVSKATQPSNFIIYDVNTAVMNRVLERHKAENPYASISVANGEYFLVRLQQRDS